MIDISYVSAVIWGFVISFAVTTLTYLTIVLYLKKKLLSPVKETVTEINTTGEFPLLDEREAIIEVRQKVKFLVNSMESMCEEAGSFDADTLMGFRLISIDVQRRLELLEAKLDKKK